VGGNEENVTEGRKRNSSTVRTSSVRNDEESKTRRYTRKEGRKEGRQEGTFGF
jgi:hypothetical protein